ncbi:hypothetical protein K438DRAFT_2136711 [Mycena galopus ATCC 62051]|nr:hypothetical protein K438DRAFT_2136711 [Mycena galopus ATCC 62051]
MENDGKPNNVNNQSKTFYSNSGGPERSGEDRNVKPEEDGDNWMITGSHPVAIRMSSGIEPEVNQRGPGVDREMAGGYRNVNGYIPEYTGSGRMSTRMIRKSDGVEEERQRKLLKAGVELPHRGRDFEPEDERHPESGGLSRKRLTFAGVRVGDPANTERMNEDGREPGVQRKKAKVKIWKQKRMKEFRKPNAGGCEMEPTSFGDSPKVTIADERTSPIIRPEVVGEIVAELFRSRNLLHVCSTVEPERMEVTEQRAGNAETKAEGGDTTTCVFATRSISANRKIRWMTVFPSTNVGAGKPGSSSGNGNGREGEGKPDGMPEQLPEEGTEGTEDAGKDTSRERRKLRKMVEVQGYAGNVKSEKDRPGSESEVDFHSSEDRQSYVRYHLSSPARETGARTNRRIRPEGPFVPEVVSTSLPEESRGGSELVKGPEEDELAEGRKT